MLHMRNIHKSFGSNSVLRSVDFMLKGGEICALLGENGAGKSTLMNILGGVYTFDQGEILINGRAVSFHSPADAQKAGIAFIHQELNLVNDLAIYENLFLGRELSRNGFLDIVRMCKETSAAFDRIGIKIDPKTIVGRLDASYKQIVEIVRALMMNASIIIMDEPTTSLTDTEINRVFEMMDTLRKQGVGIIFISHKLREVLLICDRYTVLRDGSLVAQGNVKEVTTDILAAHMVGHELITGQKQNANSKTDTGNVVLRCDKLTKPGMFRDITFELYKSEVLGFTGLLGDGRSELFQTIFGSNGAYSGTITISGKPIHITSTQTAVDAGIGYVPGNRKENGIIRDMSILENGSIVTLDRVSRWGFINRHKQKEIFNTHVKSLNIKLTKVEDLIGSLSGGNQQKVVISKWLSAHPHVLILDNPTQGVDVGAKEEIYRSITELSEAGVSIIILSNEAQEIMRLCNRAIVMYHGTIQAELKDDDITEQNIMRLATGGEGVCGIINI